MTIGRLGQRRQVVIPKEICDALGLREGDFLEVALEKRAVLVKPKKLVDAEDTLTSAEERLVRRGEAQLRRGKGVPWEKVKRKLKL